MKTRYKHIHFELMNSPFSHSYRCLTNRGNDCLGVIGPGAWKRITFRPAELTEFSAGCLGDIIHFIGQLEAARGRTRNDG